MKNMIISNKKLDSDQLDVVYNNDKYLLVVAGAGCGKTLTIVGKIKYLIEVKKYNPEEILCISFTNEATNSLKEKIDNERVNIKTFHKLGIDILNTNNVSYELSDNDYLDYIIHEFFYGLIYESEFLIRIVLSHFKCFCIFNPQKKYLHFLKDSKNKIERLEGLISRFIKQFKANGFSIDMFNVFIRKSLFRKEKLLLVLIFNIYLIYINELESSNKIDFDDILIKATGVINNGGYINKYRFIIIDEFQDTSFIKLNLIKSIINRTNANLMVVGDDFQSIYRFSGCDLDIFIDFNKFFDYARVMKLENTYRNSQELIDTAGTFIMKNKRQIKKSLKSNKRVIEPIVICKTSDLKRILDKLEGYVMLLGRNNKDIDIYLDEELVIINNDINYIKKPSLKIKYFTAHSSKGLEADNVVILNVIDDTLGFPNKISDDKLLRFVCKKDYFYEEERRLFYVALTRTKNRVYLLTKRGKESIFAKELIKKRHVKCRF